MLVQLNNNDHFHYNDSWHYYRKKLLFIYATWLKYLSTIIHNRHKARNEVTVKRMTNVKYRNKYGKQTVGIPFNHSGTLPDNLLSDTRKRH